MDRTVTKFIKRDKVKEAATALIAHHKTQEDADELLFGEPLKVQLQLSVWKIAGKKSTTHRIKLPHRPHAGSMDVCLFAKDQPNMDPEKCQMHYKDMLHSLGITNVNEVIPLKMFQKEYIPFEARRRLAKTYNLFLADARIFRLLHTHLGKEFYKRNRYPVTVNLEKKDLKSELTEAIDATYLILSNRGSCSTVVVANIGMTAEAITDNIMVAAERLGQIIPGGWGNIKSIFVRTEKSVSLPVYTSLVHQEWEEQEVEGDTGEDRENLVDNSDFKKLQRQMKFEAERTKGALKQKKDDDGDDDDEEGTVTKKNPKKKKMAAATPSPGKLAKKSKERNVGTGLRKPTSKTSGKKKK